MYQRIENDCLGIVIEIQDRAGFAGYDLTVTDTESDKVIERKYFNSLADAECHAESILLEE